MRINPYVALLDTCVLAPMPVADTLLRLAQEPAFYTPKWTRKIFEELGRTLQKFGYSKEQVERRSKAMTEAFPDAFVEGYEGLIDCMTNDPKDRHVLAAAVRCGANAVVTNNKKHFPAESLAPYELDCVSAGEFLEHQYHLNPDRFIGVLETQASEISWELPRLIANHVPELSRLIVIK